jgi:hypothetical protein
LNETLAARQDLDDDHRVWDLHRVEVDGWRANDKRVGLERGARGDPDGHSVGENPARQVRALNAFLQRNFALKTWSARAPLVRRHHDRLSAPQLPAAVASLRPEEERVDVHFRFWPGSTCAIPPPGARLAKSTPSRCAGKKSLIVFWLKLAFCSEAILKPSYRLEAGADMASFSCD